MVIGRSMDQKTCLLDRFHTIYFIGKKPPDRDMWSGERLTKRQATSRPDHLWPEIWKRDANSGKILMHTAGVMYSLSKNLKRMVTKCCDCDEGYTTIGLRISGYGAV